MMYVWLFGYYSDQAGRPKCPVDPFFIVPDKCKCVDFQVSETACPKTPLNHSRIY